MACCFSSVNPAWSGLQGSLVSPTLMNLVAPATAKASSRSSARHRFRGFIDGWFGNGKAKNRKKASRSCISGPSDVTRQRCVCAASNFEGYASTSSSSASAALEKAQKDLKALEEERDAAVATAESCARAAMKLTDMVGLLENIAMEKVAANDEDGAKQVLQEKRSTKEVLERTSTKAQANYALAAKLAQKIGEKQRDILGMLQAAEASTGKAPPQAAARPAAQAAAPSAASPPAAASPSWSPSADQAAAAGSSSMPAGDGSRWQQQQQPSEPAYRGFEEDDYSSQGFRKPKWQESLEEAKRRAEQDPALGFGVPKWQQSLEEAKQRISSIEQDANRAGRAARLSAEESIAAAKERLRAKTAGDIMSARNRILGAEESIKEGRERLRQQDAEVLAYVNRIMARYRRGEYVAEDELEFAFQQLEKRYML